MAIKAPREAGDYPDRMLECEEALEDDVIVMFEDAVSSGWTPAETAIAISNLVENYLLGLGANAQTEVQILRARIGRADE